LRYFCVTLIAIIYVTLGALKGSAMMNAKAILRWLLSQKPLREVSFSDETLQQVKKELSKEFWKPAKLSDDDEVYVIYRRLLQIAELMRDGQPIEICGYTVQILEAGEVTILPGGTKTLNRYEIVVLCAILIGKDSLRRCKECKANMPVLFVRTKRQEYCKKQCSGLARIGRHRNKKTVSTGTHT
jgi:hypothetical protein